ncbi:NUDIX domain-containing protein [Nocardioides sp. NPDC057772]|uniref:NUDIX domain-containing protein n=1 Tax=Nocardioides sp. NPDC057772 TaxID=3346245 RepID=UPI00366FE034
MDENNTFVSISNGTVGIVAANVTNASVTINGRRVTVHGEPFEIVVHYTSGKVISFTVADGREASAAITDAYANPRIAFVEVDGQSYGHGVNPADKKPAMGHNVKGDEELRGEDPRAIDWTERQERAAVPFEVRDGLPINPRPHPDLKPGKGDLWHWGEAVCSDAIVFNRKPFTNERHLLMIKRGDGHGWALPGGGLDEGESAPAGCVRELAEETGLRLHTGTLAMLPARVVDDPRAGENAWMVTVPGIVTLSNSALPAVSGQDDADEAAWLPAGSWHILRFAIAERGGVVFPAHVDLLQEALSLLDQH